MVKIDGKYKLEKNENLVPYLCALGLPEEVAKKADSFTPVMEISQEGTKYNISSDSGVKNATMTFTLGEEFQDPMPTGDILTSVATLVDNKLKICSKTSDGRSGERLFEFNETQCILTMTSTVTPVVAIRTYKRL